MILEGMVTTVSATGEVNIAPMGPRVDVAMRRLLLRPYKTSQTYQNLKVHPEGVFHVTDDVLLLARAALGRVEPAPRLRQVDETVWVLEDACRYYQFRVISMDESSDRVVIETEVYQEVCCRDFFGFNRAKHAVIEAAILATRTDFLPLDEIQAEFRKLAVLVDKTGGPREHEAFQFLQGHVDQVAARRAGEGRP